MNGKKSNRPKERAKILNDFDHCVIKRTIHGLCSRKIAPTVSIIHKEIKDSIKISKSNLTLALIDLGYTYIKIGDNRRVLYDQVFIINYMCNYLRKIKSSREAGYDIVYMDETWVTKITAQIICGFRMMGLMPQKYPRVKANVCLFCMQVREVRA